MKSLNSHRLKQLIFTTTMTDFKLHFATLPFCITSILIIWEPRAHLLAVPAHRRFNRRCVSGSAGTSNNRCSFFLNRLTIMTGFNGYHDCCNGSDDSSPNLGVETDSFPDIVQIPTFRRHLVFFILSLVFFIFFGVFHLWCFSSCLVFHLVMFIFSVRIPHLTFFIRRNSRVFLSTFI